MKKTVVFLCVILITLSLFVGCKKDEKATTYILDLTYNDQTYTVDGKLDFTYYHTYEEPISELKFNLYPNAYRENAKYTPVATQYYSRAYYDGLSYGYIDVKSVTSDKLKEFSIGGEDKNLLIVTLNDNLFKGERVNVNIDFTTKLAKVKHRLGVTENVVNLSDFYPVLCGYDKGFYVNSYCSLGDPYFFDTANYKVSITLPNYYTVASSGKVISSTHKEHINKFTYVINNARSFALAFSKEYDMVSTQIDGVSVNYYYYKQRNHEKVLETAKKALTYFEKTFGKYPYETLTVAETGFIQGGMEYSSFALISEELEENAFNEVVIHETAHQWWYGAVGSNQYEYAFLDEGLTEYSVLLFYENHPEYNFTREQLIDSSLKTYRTYCDVYDKIFGRKDTSMVRPLKDFTSEYEYVNIAYVKPCIMFDTLRSLIGDTKFFKGLKKYYAENLYLSPTPYALQGAFEKTGIDINGFFDGYYSGKVII